MYDATNRLEFLNGQPVYTFDANGNLLESDVLTNTFDAANRLIAVSRQPVAVSNLYNGVGDRVGQVTDGVTTTFALDVQGLPEVIYTSDDEAYLHLLGVIMTEKAGTVRYLLSDGLGSVRQAVDDTGVVVAYHEFDPYGNPVENEGGEPYGYTGEWWEDEVELLHLRTRWYLPETGTFLSKDAWEGNEFRPQSLNTWSYVEGNPINATDPSGLYAYSNLPRSSNKFKHTVIQEWFERRYGYWNSVLEFGRYNYLMGVPDILHFPRIANPALNQCTSPLDFSTTGGWTGEIYEIEPIRLLPVPGKEVVTGAEQLFGYYVGLNLIGGFGGLRGKIHEDPRRRFTAAPYINQSWDFNTIHWKLGTSMPSGPWQVPLTGHQPLLVVRPVPGLILYADDKTRNQTLKVLGTALTLQLVARIARSVVTSNIPKFSPSPTLPIFPIVPDPSYYFCQKNPGLCGQEEEDIRS